VINIPPLLSCPPFLRPWMSRQILAAPAWSRTRAFGRNGLRSRNKNRTRGFWLFAISLAVIAVYAVGNIIIESFCHFAGLASVPTAPMLLDYRRLIARQNIRRTDRGLGTISEYRRVEPRFARRFYEGQHVAISDGSRSYEYKPSDEAFESKGLSL
jgi:hypothetical protein